MAATRPALDLPPPDVFVLDTEGRGRCPARAAGGPDGWPARGTADRGLLCDPGAGVAATLGWSGNACHRFWGFEPAAPAIDTDATEAAVATVRQAAKRFVVRALISWRSDSGARGTRSGADGRVFLAPDPHRRWKQQRQYYDDRAPMSSGRRRNGLMATRPAKRAQRLRNYA
jgi:hypothetical protein